MMRSAEDVERIEELEAERDAALEREQALAAHVERIITEWNSSTQIYEPFSPAWIDHMGDVIEAAPATSLARRDAGSAKEIHLALIEGAKRNNLRGAPTAEQAIDFLLSLARQEWEKRKPLQLHHQAEQQRSESHDD